MAKRIYASEDLRGFGVFLNTLRRNGHHDIADQYTGTNPELRDERFDKEGKFIGVQTFHPYNAMRGICLPSSWVENTDDHLNADLPLFGRHFSYSQRSSAKSRSRRSRSLK